MKAFAKLTVLAALAVSGAAYADNLNIVYQTNVMQPAHVSQATAPFAFNPGTNKIVFQLLGKTCTFNSSGNPWNAGAGAGCNYVLTVNTSNGAMNLQSNANGCTVAADLATACR